MLIKANAIDLLKNKQNRLLFDIVRSENNIVVICELVSLDLQLQINASSIRLRFLNNFLQLGNHFEEARF